MRFPFSFHSMPRSAAAALILTAAVAASVSASFDADARPKASKAWRKAASKIRSAEKSEVKANYLLELARSLALPAGAARDAVVDAAKDARAEGLDLVKERYKGRLQLAEDLGEDEIYAGDFDPADFAKVIDNPYLPLTPGVTRTYEVIVDGEVEETIVVTVLNETKMIAGVECTVVRDTVSIDGKLVEDTYDWFAQDKDGNVWYFGEIALNYDDNGDVSNIDGSWLTGVGGARPGIVMKGTRAVGDKYRQEFWFGEAEDYAEILSLNATAAPPFGNFTNCVQTFDGTPMEPDAAEHKYYAAGIGFVLEIKPEDGERVELISVTNSNN